MKRSEMLRIIVDKLELMRGVQEGYYMYPETALMADMLLTELENNGMLPPDNGRSNPQDEHQWDEFFNE